MIKVLKKIKFSFDLLRCIPHLIVFYTHKNKKLIHVDTRRWLQVEKIDIPLAFGFIYLLSFFREFRNLFYSRIGVLRSFLRFFCHENPNLIIRTRNIGEGFFILHGFSTIINAKSIGKNCLIGQQVTIEDSPVLLNNVRIHSGAIIIGNITIGNNSVIGANATVFHDIPDNCLVIPSLSVDINMDSVLDLQPNG